MSIRARIKTRYFTGEASLVTGHYLDGTRAIVIRDDDGLVAAKVTVWVDGLAPDEIAIKDYSENEGMLEAMRGLRIVQPPHRYVDSHHVTIPVCRLGLRGRKLFKEEPDDQRS